MAFFTRKGFTVPELPHEGTLTEEPEEPYCSQSSTSSQNHQLSRIVSSQQIGDGSDTPTAVADDESNTSATLATVAVTATKTTHSTGGVSLATTKVAQNDAKEREKFDYVVDRTYGVEV